MASYLPQISSLELCLYTAYLNDTYMSLYLLVSFLISIYIVYLVSETVRNDTLANTKRVPELYIFT